MFYRKLYRELIKEAERYGLIVIEKQFKSSAGGLCKGNKIAINSTIKSYREKADILAEEIAHCLFTIGDILDTRSEDNYIQEEIARTAAADRLKGKAYNLEIAPPGSYGYFLYNERRCV